MKFKLSTLLWILTLTAVLVSSWLWVKSEREQNAQKITEVEKNAEELRLGFQKFAEEQLAWVPYFRRELGLFADNAESYQGKPQIKFVRLPQVLGGMQSHGLPFTWQWRMRLPNPEDFELCICLEGIPKKKDDFDVPGELVYRSHLNLFNGIGIANAGTCGMSDDVADLAALKDNPVEVAMYIRIDADDSGGRIFVNYEVAPISSNIPGTSIYRGQGFSLSRDQVAWMMEPGVSMHRGGYSLSGFGIEHRGQQFPLLDNTFSLESPTTLVRVKAKKKLGQLKFESYPEQAKGLFIWVQRKQENAKSANKPPSMPTTITLPELKTK